MRKDEKLNGLISLSIRVSEKAMNIQATEKLKEDHRRNTENEIKKMLNTEIYYALASRKIRVDVQKMASSLLKVHKLRGRMAFISKIARDLVDRKMVRIEDLSDQGNIGEPPPRITIRQRPNDTVGGPTHTWIRVSKPMKFKGICALVIPTNGPMNISTVGSKDLYYDEIKELLDFTLEEFDKFEAEFIKRVEKWLSK